MKKLSFILAPFTIIYGGIVATRNLLFDLKILPNIIPQIPSIGIGILNVGSFRTFNREIASHTQQGGDDVITYTTPIGENGLGAGLSNNGQLKDKHHHFFFEGKKELIDTENEWFLDTTNDILYIKPPNGVDLFQTPVRGKIRDYSLTISCLLYTSPSPRDS